MAVIYQHSLENLNRLLITGPSAEVVNWQGQAALRLDGLALLRRLPVAEGSIEVQIGADGPCYPGIAFHAADMANYELAYVQPHTSGAWDAVQYDPVFHGSNTWQLYHGPGAQIAAEIPTGRWLTLRVDFDEPRALVQVENQPPLLVNRLAHNRASGLAGIWTYLPAYFRDLRIRRGPVELPDPLPPAEPPPGAVTEWFLEGFGRVACEPGGALNLNRYLPVAAGQARLTRHLQVQEETTLEVQFGFSDALELQVDGQTIYTGENLWHDEPQWERRGYVALRERVTARLTPGPHRLAAVLKVSEYFGWGLALALGDGPYQLLPAELGQDARFEGGMPRWTAT